MEPITQGELVAVRRELHRHAEPGWCEIFAATKVVNTLTQLGWQVQFGEEVISRDARMGLPAQATLDFYYQQALAAGADPKIADRLRGGFTGVVGILKGMTKGPTVAFRFDLDANQGVEAAAPDHFPAREGFGSIHTGVHHNCGHDGHTSMGLGLARAITMMRETLTGEVRLIFQPAEEGLRGAKAMVAAGVLKDVEYFVGCHLGVQALAVGEIVAGYNNILGSVKLDIEFTGQGAHAAISPHVGRNALLAACVSAQNLMAIPRHGEGDTRINVGSIKGGDSRNTVPSAASMIVELRSDNEVALQYLKEAADRIVTGAAGMHGVTSRVEQVGESRAASSDPELSKVVALAANDVPSVTKIRDAVDFKGSDDAAEMMRTVQSDGGKAVYFGVGTELNAVHHNPYFDFDERALSVGVEVLKRILPPLGAAKS